MKKLNTIKENRNKNKQKQKQKNTESPNRRKNQPTTTIQRLFNWKILRVLGHNDARLSFATNQIIRVNVSARRFMNELTPSSPTHQFTMDFWLNLVSKVFTSVWVSMMLMLFRVTLILEFFKKEISAGLFCCLSICYLLDGTVVVVPLSHSHTLTTNKNQKQKQTRRWCCIIMGETRRDDSMRWHLPFTNIRHYCL